MYVTTFYSFKGGVGRSMALVNVAAELAQTGKRVLVVDFDLEAPGLDTFDLPHPRGPNLGIVEYVAQYLADGAPPELTEYVYRVPKIGAAEGGLWVMPAGVYDEGYAKRLAAIDWENLYSERSGYLLFENLKEQWKELVAPDYVLIDSRTGYSDICGICTRQLPDAVALLFFPNEQNLRGLKKVVQDIRSESSKRSTKPIQLHFVMSNVPDLDDEQKILAARMRDFERELGIDASPHRIYRYSSLALLNQTVFTLERPDSRLAKEYRAFTQALVRGNPEDRTAALEYLRELRDPRKRQLYQKSPDELERHLEKIQEKHPSDGEVLFHLGSFRLRLRKFSEAETLLSLAIAAGYDRADSRLARAEARMGIGQLLECADDALAALHNEAAPLQLEIALELVRAGNAARVSEIANTAAVQASTADIRIWLAQNLNCSKRELQAARVLLEPLSRDPNLIENQRDSVKLIRSLISIGLGAFNEAMTIISPTVPLIENLDILDAFNYGMALWGRDGEPSREFFARVIALAATALEPSSPPAPNLLECCSIAHWVAGDKEHAKDFLDRARTALIEHGAGEFSCWRYRYASPSEFLSDLEEISALLSGARIQPAFIRPDGDDD